MSVVARFDIPADDFVLGRVLTADGQVDVDLDAAIPLGRVHPLQVWVDADHATVVERTLVGSPHVERSRRLGCANGRTLFCVEWEGRDRGFADGVTAAGATVLEGYCEDGWWAFRMRFPEFQSLSTFYDRCTKAGMTLDVRQLRDLTQESPQAPYGLTEPQYRTLRVALERGYFAIPRGITLTELADELDVSDTAASQRLRRGLASVLSATLR